MDTTISWKELGFRYLDTGVFVRADFRHGAWSAPELCSGASLSIHIAATCFHYGQACFEGLKAFRQKSGRVACFRADAHARRMIMSANRLVMVPPPQELFLEAVRLIVSRNDAYVPPFGTGATLYVRPLLLGTSAVIGVHASDDYTFLIFAMPVGPYYKNGMVPVPAYVQESYDRAAPHGDGDHADLLDHARRADAAVWQRGQARQDAEAPLRRDPGHPIRRERRPPPLDDAGGVSGVRAPRAAPRSREGRP